MVEFYHQAPSPDKWLIAIQKQIALHGHHKADYPVCWVITAGRPNTLIRQANLTKMVGWPKGFYEGAPLFRTRLVVVSELPKGRETLLLRLLGKQRVLEEAIQECLELEKGARERVVAGALVVELGLHLHRTEVEMVNPYQKLREEYMAAQEAIWLERGMEKGLERGLEKGLEKGLDTGIEKGRAILLDLYRLRLGPLPENHAAALANIHDFETLARINLLLATGTPEEVASTLNTLQITPSHST